MPVELTESGKLSAQGAYATVYVGVLGAYVINDFTTPLGAPFWRLFYAVTFMAVLLIGALRIAQAGHVRYPQGLTALFLAVALLAVSGLLMALLQDQVNLLYLLGDFATLAMLGATVLLVAQLPALYLQSRYLRLLVGLLIVATLVGLLIGGKFQGERFAGRFDPPHVLLFAATLAAFLTSRRRWIRVLLALAVVALIFVALKSGQRTAPIVFVLLAFAAVLSTLGGVRAIGVACVVALVLTAAFVFFGDRIIATLQAAFLESAAEYRYQELVEAGEDQSIEGRLFEAADVIEISRDANLGKLLFGHGHGATFKPDLSYPEPNVTEVGRVHNIHIGPFLLLFRYGLLGVALYLWLGYMLFVDLFRMRKYRSVMRDAGGADALFMHVTLYLAMAGAFMNFHLRTVLNDPIWSFVIAAYFGFRGSGISPVSITRDRYVLRPRRTPSAAGSS